LFPASVNANMSTVLRVTYAKIIRSVEIPEFWALYSYGHWKQNTDVPKPVFS